MYEIDEIEQKLWEIDDKIIAMNQPGWNWRKWRADHLDLNMVKNQLLKKTGKVFK